MYLSAFTRLMPEKRQKKRKTCLEEKIMMLHASDIKHKMEGHLVVKSVRQLLLRDSIWRIIW